VLLQQTKEQLRTLKLSGFLEALEQRQDQPRTHELGFEQRLGFLVEREVLHRENRRLSRLLRTARLRVPACVEDIDYGHPRGLDKSVMASLAQLDWVRSGLNLCITGRTGCGKTWLACALGNQSCRQGLSVRYVRLPRLLEQLRISHAIEDRHGHKSTLIASQLPVKHWHDYIGEATMSDAILDRLLHGSRRLELSGESMRKLEADASSKKPADLTDRDRSK